MVFVFRVSREFLVVIMKKPPDLFRFRGFGGSGYEAGAVM